jgi:hypothetical protein
MSIEFTEFPSIKRMDSIGMSITQKLHGTNAQVYIERLEGDPPIIESEDVNFIKKVDDVIYLLKVGSRTRWITPDNDNYGFAGFIYANAEEFIRKLGPGRHDGEWVGPGINSTEGFTEKTFVLFDFWKWPPERALPLRTQVVPVLYNGQADISKVGEVMADLKANGSKAVPGFMNVEGVVVSLGGTRYKKVFQAEETKWTGVKKEKAPKSPVVDYSYLLQPIRLEKLLSRDEAYRRDYPASLPTIVKDYVDDLIKEEQVTAEVAATDRKAIAQAVYPFVKVFVGT